jgi:hypothetical protein
MIKRGMRYVFYGTNDLNILGKVYRQGHEQLTSFAAAHVAASKGKK